MAYQIPIKYFNSFWLKKVVGSTDLNPKDEIEGQGGTWDSESTVTTMVTGGGGRDKLDYILPTWPGIPWGKYLAKDNPDDPLLKKTYPCFPWGGRDWDNYLPPLYNLPDCGGSLLNQTPSQEEGRERNWAIEEARIKGGYNNTTVDFGVKAYLVDDNNLAERRFNTLIYSGVFNSRTGLNETNVFNPTEGSITVSTDPANGSIQKLYAYDTNLTIFQENKVSKALIDKDAIYSAEGDASITSTKLVIGQVTPYKGEYGISKNPESWAQFGFRQYFSDKYRSAILRLSNDGLTEISTYGMTDYFRDELALIDDNPIVTTSIYSYLDEGLLPIEYIWVMIIEDINCDCSKDIPVGSLLEVNGITIPGLFVTEVSSLGGGKCNVRTSIPWRPAMFGLATWPTEIVIIFNNNDSVQGGFDTHNKNYVISLQNYSSEPAVCKPTFEYNTLNFDEAINGWVSFYSYNPTVLDSIKNEYFSVDGHKVYKHYSEGLGNNFGTFYGVHEKSSIEFIFNPKPSMVKNFQTVSYEGSNGWQVDYFISDATEQLYNNFSGTYYAARDEVNAVYSKTQGTYINTETQMSTNAGFFLKENRYVANLVNKSEPFEGEVVFGTSMSGIKGYFATLRLSTDIETTDTSGNILTPTDLGGMKELYAVGAKWVPSS
jgi:hypothetical protein